MREMGSRGSNAIVKACVKDQFALSEVYFKSVAQAPAKVKENDFPEVASSWYSLRA